VHAVKNATDQLNDFQLHRAIVYRVSTTVRKWVTQKSWPTQWQLVYPAPMADSTFYSNLMRKRFAVSRAVQAGEERIFFYAVNISESHWVGVVFDTRRASAIGAMKGMLTVWDPMGGASQHQSALLKALKSKRKVFHINVVDEKMQSDGFRCGDWVVTFFERYAARAVEGHPLGFEMQGSRGVPFDLRDPAATDAHAASNLRWATALRTDLQELTDPAAATAALESVLSRQADDFV
jgi:hypothetical protein